MIFTDFGRESNRLRKLRSHNTYLQNGAHPTTPYAIMKKNSNEFRRLVREHRRHSHTIQEESWTVNNSCWGRCWMRRVHFRRKWRRLYLYERTYVRIRYMIDDGCCCCCDTWGIVSVRTASHFIAVAAFDTSATRRRNADAAQALLVTERPLHQNQPARRCCFTR